MLLLPGGWVFLGAFDHGGEEVIEAIRCRFCGSTGRLVEEAWRGEQQEPLETHKTEGVVVEQVRPQGSRQERDGGSFKLLPSTEWRD